MEGLRYVRPSGRDADGNYKYELIFSKNPEDVVTNEWYEENPSVCSEYLLDDGFLESCAIVRTISSDMKLVCAQEQSCFSMLYAYYGCMCLAYEDISELEMYPEPYRIVLGFGDSVEHVRELLEGREIELED